MNAMRLDITTLVPGSCDAAAVPGRVPTRFALAS
jgi:hypothetical protein